MDDGNLPPPSTSFGHPLRILWSIDPGLRFLNHGSFGAAPRHVLAAQVRWRGCSVRATDQEPRRLSLRPLVPAAGGAGFSARRPVTYLCRTLAIRVW